MHTTLVLGVAAVSLLATTTSHAQPSLVEAAPPPTASTDLYLEPGVEVGLSHAGFYGALALDGGYRLGDTPLWLHGRFAHGGMTAIEGTTMSSDFTEARLGLERRGCILRGIACLVGGVDVAYRHEVVMAGPDNDTADLGLAITRLGLDLGSEHLRFRPSAEASFGYRGWNGFGLVTGIAYTW